MKTSDKIIAQTQKFIANHYDCYPVVISEANGVKVWDVEGKEYLDFLACYSALNFGHLHPKLVAAVEKQLRKLTLISGAFYTENLGRFGEDLAEFTGMERSLPMNTGAEGVETAIKLVRKYGYIKKGIKKDRAKIIFCSNNFHGRTTTISGASTTLQYREYFGPYDSGTKFVNYGNAEELELAADDENVVAFIVEPIQGEGGIVVPPVGYFGKVREICNKTDTLLVLDEVQTGFGRTGYDLAHHYEGIKPDVLVLGKALGGGILPVSTVIASPEVMEVFEPGDHGSTFGGNPLACAVGIEVLKLMNEENLSERSAKMGQYFIKELRKIKSPYVHEVRGRGLMIGIGVESSDMAHDMCRRLVGQGVLCTNARNVVRLSPPLIVTEDEINWALERIEKVL